VAAVGAGSALAGCASSSGGGDDVVPFYGASQAGISTDVQDRLAFAAFDVTTTSKSDLVQMLKTWTAAAEAMTRGVMVPGESNAGEVPPADTGETIGLPPSQLTVTIGFGPSLFDQRFGLAAHRPAAFSALPALPGEILDPNRTGGDIGIQACANDPAVAFHAVRNLARLGKGTAVTRWTQLGFGRTASTGTDQQTERNLMGFKDGTRNIKSDDKNALEQFVWVGDEAAQPWMKGGSYLVARRIRMFIENWDRDYLQDQENVIGRAKSSGAPLSGGSEFTTPNLHARDAEGSPLIPVNAHIRLASRETNDGIQILRRSYSYTDGIDPELGTLLSGLFFIAFMKNPDQFVTLQNRLGAHDALNEYIQHTGSGLFACPPGLSKGEHWGDALLG
jgi:deferrochelatase/peroxidase EfeB